MRFEKNAPHTTTNSPLGVESTAGPTSYIVVSVLTWKKGPSPS